MISVVLDPVTLLQGLGYHDAPASGVVAAALTGRYVPITSPALLDQLDRGLRTRRLRGAFPRARRLVELVAELSVVVETPGREHPLVEAAVAGRATYLVTSDIPLLRLGSVDETRIVRPR